MLLIKFNVELIFSGCNLVYRRSQWRKHSSCLVCFIDEGWLALNHRRNTIASLRYVAPHPTTTEVLNIEDFLIKSTLYTSSESSMADDYPTLSFLSALPALVAGVGLVFFQQVAGQPSVSRLCKHHLPRHRCVINCCHRYLILQFSYYFNGYNVSIFKLIE